ncbi:MAG: AMIN domain-containing protein, partial [Pseudomonadota bacterium]|nr:AMIN domain-containing protein [Pseudomonadota bacterium]
MNDIHKVTRRKKSGALFLITALLLTGVFLSSSIAESPGKIITLKALALNDTVTLRFAGSADEKINYKIFTLDSPPRLVIDFPEASYKKNN